MKKSTWVHPAVVIVAGIGLAGCGAKQAPEKNVTKEPWEVRVESPLDTIQVTPQTQTAAQTVPSETQPTPVMDTPVVTETAAAMPASSTNTGTAAQTVPSSVPDSKSFIPGWRVQIHAFPTMANAEAAAAKARQHFTEPVYVEYQAPMYKVRVGDFLTKDDARLMVNRAKAENYTQAWVVEDLVMRPGN
jgi:cell division septation protein DedD